MFADAAYSNEHLLPLLGAHAATAFRLAWVMDIVLKHTFSFDICLLLLVEVARSTEVLPWLVLLATLLFEVVVSMHWIIVVVKSLLTGLVHVCMHALLNIEAFLRVDSKTHSTLIKRLLEAWLLNRRRPGILPFKIEILFNLSDASTLLVVDCVKSV